MVLANLVCGCGARSARKPHTIETETTALPKAKSANCVCPLLLSVVFCQAGRKMTDKQLKSIGGSSGDDAYIPRTRSRAVPAAARLPRHRRAHGRWRLA